MVIELIMNWPLLHEGEGGGVASSHKIGGREYHLTLGHRVCRGVIIS
jgi:hypothetical protein